MSATVQDQRHTVEVINEVVNVTAVGQTGPASLAVGSVITTQGHEVFGGVGGTPTAGRGRTYNVKAFGAVLDGTTDDRTPLLNAIGAADTAGGGTVDIVGDLAFSGAITVPSGVHLVGAGSAAIASKAATRLVALGATAKISFADGYGGGSHFCIDGNALATGPLVILARIGTFHDIDIINTAGGTGSFGWKCDRTQNSVFLNVNTSGIGGDHLVLDGGASSNFFLRCEFATVLTGKWGIRLDTTYGVGAGAIWYFPRDNVFDRCLVEFGTAGGALLLAAGENNVFRACNLNRGAATSAVNVVETSRDTSVVPENSSGLNRLENCIVLGVQAQTTGIKVGANTSLFFGLGTLLSLHAVGIDVNATGTTVRTDGDYIKTSITTFFTSPNGALENTSLKEFAKHWREIERPSLADIVESTLQTGDTSARFLRYVNGTMEWGPGNAARDISLQRIAANLLGTAAGDAIRAGGGLWSQAMVTKTTAYTAIVESDQTILGDATSAAFTVTLPTAVGNTGKLLTIKKIDSSANAVTIDGNGAQTIDGAATVALSAQWAFRTIVSDGSNWVVVASG